MKVHPNNMSERGFVKGAVSGVVMALVLVGIATYLTTGGAAPGPQAGAALTTTTTAYLSTSTTSATVPGSLQAVVSSTSACQSCQPFGAEDSIGSTLNSNPTDFLRTFSPFVLAMAVGVLVYLSLSRGRQRSHPF